MQFAAKLSCLCMTFVLFSCGENKKDKSDQAFNEGITFSMNSIEEQGKGKPEKAVALNKQAIDKFKETLKIDSAHELVRSALAYSLYMDKQFKNAIHWFEQANKVKDGFAANYRGMGLCKINLGQIREGKADIDHAFSLDTTKEIREITVEDLNDIGESAFLYGDEFMKEGNREKAKDYQTFAVGVLMLAFEYDRSRKDIALTIAGFAEKLGDKETVIKYKKLGGA